VHSAASIGAVSLAPRAIEARLTEDDMQAIPLDAKTIVTVAMAFLGALFYVASLSMRTVIPLRIAAIASACFFLVYGILAYSITTVFLYAILVPLNSLRLYQLIQLIKRVRIAAGQDLSMDWLEPFMTKRKCREGEMLFRKNDEANEMFLAAKGTYVIPELDKKLQPGEIFGELGLMTSERRRTASVQCVESGHVLAITYDKMRELYFENPEFGFYLLRLVSERLLQEVARLERALALAQQKAS
jgi:CRP-like cAMP-binding protein